MKKFIIAFCICLIAGNVFAGAFDAQDEEARIVASFVRATLGEALEETIREEYNVKSLAWGARGQAADIDELTVTYLVYCEADTVEDGPLYWYMELKISAVNGNSKLLRKYGLD